MTPSKVYVERDVWRMHFPMSEVATWLRECHELRDDSVKAAAAMRDLRDLGTDQDLLPDDVLATLTEGSDLAWDASEQFSACAELIERGGRFEDVQAAFQRGQNRNAIAERMMIRVNAAIEMASERFLKNLQNRTAS